MGNRPSVFYIYGRLEATDRWEGQPLHAFKQAPLGKFKHAIYAMGLRRRFIDYHKIYLYEHNTRIAKCYIRTDAEHYRTLEVTFDTAEHMAAYEQAQETLFGNTQGWLTEEFTAVYRCMDGAPLQRRYVSSRPIG
jgi:hypothetical protein